MGEKVVPIVVTTDSEVTPRIALSLRMAGGRKPPYVMMAEGDLIYRGADWPTTPRVIEVATVEPLGEDRRPLLESDLACYRFRYDSKLERPHHEEAGYVTRVHCYLAEFQSPPGPGPFIGEVRVIDPWDGSRAIRLHVDARLDPPIRATPARLRVAVRPGSDAKPLGTLLLTTRLIGVVLAPREPGSCPLKVVRSSTVPGGEGTLYEVRWRPGFSICEGTCELVACLPSHGPESIVVPVLVTREAP